MKVVFDRVVWTSYGQLYLLSGDEWGLDMTEAFAGQANGLCGAGCADRLFLMIGPNTAEVRVRIEVHDGPPPVGDEWEDVVEASFVPASPRLRLASCMGDNYDLPGLDTGCHRVRYSAAGMDEARMAEVEAVEDDPAGEPVDRYLLQMWPAPLAPDKVIRQSDGVAVSMHRGVRALPAPPTAEQQVAMAEAARQN